MDKLRKLAEAVLDIGVIGPEAVSDPQKGQMAPLLKMPSEIRATYIAAADPKSIIELLDKLEAATESAKFWKVECGLESKAADKVEGVINSVKSHIDRDGWINRNELNAILEKHNG